MAERFPVRHYTTLDSTNLEAARLAAAGVEGPLWIVSGEQLSGRGRDGRVWQSRPGGVYATLLYPSAIPHNRIAEFGAAMSLAVRETLAAFVPLASIILKWPNDCLVDGAKICGILSEVCGRDPLRVAIGCGVNVEHKPQDMPYAVACVRDYAPTARVSDVFDALNASCAAIFSGMVEMDAGAMWRKWAVHAQPVGTPLLVRSARHALVGSYAGLADDGALILTDHSGQRHVVHAGDVLLEQA